MFKTKLRRLSHRRYCMSTNVIDQYQAEKIAEHMINIADNLYMASLVTLSSTLQPFMEGVRVFYDNKYIKEFATSDDLRSTSIGLIVFNYASSSRTAELHAAAVNDLVNLLLRND